MMARAMAMFSLRARARFRLRPRPRARARAVQRLLVMAMMTIPVPPDRKALRLLPMRRLAPLANCTDLPTRHPLCRLPLPSLRLLLLRLLLRIGRSPCLRAPTWCRRRSPSSLRSFALSRCARPPPLPQALPLGLPLVLPLPLALCNDRLAQIPCRSNRSSTITRSETRTAAAATSRPSCLEPVSKRMTTYTPRRPFIRWQRLPVARHQPLALALLLAQPPRPLALVLVLPLVLVLVLPPVLGLAPPPRDAIATRTRRAAPCRRCAFSTRPCRSPTCARCCARIGWRRRAADPETRRYQQRQHLNHRQHQRPNQNWQVHHQHQHHQRRRHCCLWSRSTNPFFRPSLTTRCPPWLRFRRQCYGS